MVISLELTFFPPKYHYWFSPYDNRMSALKELGPLVRLGQLSGLFPFTMEVNPKTGQFIRFHFSWKHYVTFYYISVWIFQITFHIIIAIVALQFINNIEDSVKEKLKLPLGVVILTVLIVAFYVLTYMLAKLVVLCKNRFSRTVAFIQKVEQELTYDLLDRKSSVMKRTIIGFIVIACLVSFFCLKYFGSYITINCYCLTGFFDSCSNISYCQDALGCCRIFCHTNCVRFSGLYAHDALLLHSPCLSELLHHRLLHGNITNGNIWMLECHLRKWVCYRHCCVDELCY